jgi:sarcosine dehydrogenase
VTLKSNAPFVGRDAAAKAAASPLRKKLAGFTTDDPDIVLLGRETILRNGEFAGYLTSGGYGYTVGKPIGYGYVRNGGGIGDDWLAEGDYELVVAKERVPAKLHMEALYDPKAERVKG